MKIVCHAHTHAYIQNNSYKNDKYMFEHMGITDDNHAHEANLQTKETIHGHMHEYK